MSLYACAGCGVVQTDDENACKVCGTDRFEDVETDDTSESYTCEECDRSFDSKRGLSNHERVHEEDDEEEEEDDDEEDDEKSDSFY